jgi:DMSO reductase anchor subunit
MIYRSLKPVPRWSNRWTVPGYLTLALASGALWLQAMATLGAGRPALPGIWIILLLALAWGTKQLYWRWIDQPQPGGSTMESATGLGHLGRVRPLDPPHTSENYVMKEMGFQIARKHAAKLRRIALATGLVLPVLLIGIGWLVPVLLIPASILAALIGTLGVLVERWLFFAEARHVALLYYRPDAA